MLIFLFRFLSRAKFPVKHQCLAEELRFLTFDGTFLNTLLNDGVSGMAVPADLIIRDLSNPSGV